MPAGAVEVYRATEQVTEQAAQGQTEQVEAATQRRLPRKRPVKEVSTTDSKGNPRSLLSFLKAAGGLQDDPGGELRGRDLRKARPGLISRKGKRLDDAALIAYEAGYIGKQGERGSIDDLLEAIDNELRGNKVYAQRDLGAAMVGGQGQGGG